MFERTRRLVALAIPVAAVLVIVIGLWPRTETTTDPEARARGLAAGLKCPFCSGESLADSTSSVARDYRVLIGELVAAGRTDDEIEDEFVARFGEQILLDPPGTGWGMALWAAPLAVAVLGGLAILGLRRRSRGAVDVDIEVGAEP